MEALLLISLLTIIKLSQQLKHLQVLLGGERAVGAPSEVDSGSRELKELLMKLEEDLHLKEVLKSVTKGMLIKAHSECSLRKILWMFFRS